MHGSAMAGVVCALEPREPYVVRSTRIEYSSEQVMSKMRDHKWRRQEVLAFLVVLRLQSVEVSETCGPVEEARFSRLKTGVRHVVGCLREISRRIYENNVWFAPGDDGEVAEELRQVKRRVEKICEATGGINAILGKMKSYIRDEEGGDEGGRRARKALGMICGLGDGDARMRAEVEQILGEETENSKLLAEEFGIATHYAHVSDHKDLLYLVYSELEECFQKVRVVDIVFHDWSKFLLDLSLGYTWNWVVNPRDAKEEPSRVKAWKNGALRPEARWESFCEQWNVAVRLHLTSEKHHPDYYDVFPNEEWVCDAWNVPRSRKKDDMEDRELENSVLDMASMEIMRILKSGGKIKDVLGRRRYMGFAVRFLNRYNPGDVEKVVGYMARTNPEIPMEPYSEYINRRKEDAEVVH